MAEDDVKPSWVTLILWVAAWMQGCVAVEPSSPALDAAPAMDGLDVEPLRFDQASGVVDALQTSLDQLMNVADVADVLPVRGSTFTLPDTPSPADPAIGVQMGSDHGCLLTRSGAVWCWASKEGVPYGSRPDNLRPRRILGLPPIVELAPSEHELARDAEGNVYSWYWVYYCANRRWSPPVRLELARRAVSFCPHGNCILQEDGTIRTVLPHWSGTTCTERSTTPVRDAVAADSIASTGCAVTRSGRLQCFAPRPLIPDEDPFRWWFWPSVDLRGTTQVLMQQLSQCLLHESGRVVCWGHGGYGQTGTFAGLQSCGDLQGEVGWGYPPSCHLEPTPVPGIDDAVALIGINPTVCALRRNGTVWCWGANINNSMGLTRPPTMRCLGPLLTVGTGLHCMDAPAPIAGLRDVVAFSDHQAGWCAVLRDGRVFCLGSLVGDGTWQAHDTPVEVRWGP